MKQHTSEFKNTIKEQGRRIDGIITYGNTTLRNEIYKINPHFKANILKSVMKELDLELSVEIPVGTIVNCKIGLLVGNAYEYMDYGNYIVYKVEKQEDKDLYSIKCYDKMLYSMKDYESLSVPYPITIRNYINAICNKLGITFHNSNTEFANYNKEIPNELYLDSDGDNLGYTYRDVLDELAEVTGSIILINKDDELEIKYPQNTGDTIDEHYLKDTNVNFDEKYGAVNLLVLSRSGGADNIYYPDVLPENPCEIRIEDNQIMNFNDRNTYMPAIFNKINGLEYYINNFESTGILYYDIGDFYNVEVKDKTYKCLMLNDEIEVTTGLSEIIYTDMPEQSETDYKKADKIDRIINQTNLIVDKQNQRIEGIVSQIGDRSQKQTTITQDIDGINSKVEDLEDLTDTAEGVTELTLQNCIEGSLLELHIYGNNSVFDYLFPANDLYPADDLYPRGDSRIVVTDEENNSVLYELGIMDVLRQNGDVRDEFVLEENKGKVIRRINQDGTIKTNEIVEDLGELDIHLKNGINTIRIKNYNAQMQAKFALKNTYTDIFTTKFEVKSSIEQTADAINLEVSKKADTAEVDSKISQTAEEINSEVRKKVGEDEVISKINQSAEQVSIQANKISLSGKELNLTGDNMTIKSTNFNVDKDGNATLSGSISISSGALSISSSGIETNLLRIKGNTYFQEASNIQGNNSNLNGFAWIGSSRGFIGDLTVTTLSYSSLESKKTSFEKLKNALDIINQIEIYKYRFKEEEKDSKKHIGFVIGDKYKYSEELTSKNNDGVDLYSFISVCCKAIQEQQEEIEELKNKIKEIEELKNKIKEMEENYVRKN